MDPLSHAALGAAWAAPVVRSQQFVAAAAAGAIASLVPDADFLIRSAGDPLLAMEYHRGFTHALLFSPAGAALCALAIFPVWRRWLTFSACALCCLLGWLSHELLDACTSYGTELFWPFSRERVALDLVSAVDPLLTLPLLGLVAYGLLRRQRAFAMAGIAWVSAYLAVASMQQLRAEDAARELAASRGHAPAHIEVKPSLGNIFLWRTIYEAGGDYHIDAVRVGLEAQHYSGEIRPKLDLARDFPWLLPDMQQWSDVERLARLTSGYLAVDEQNGNRIEDIRYSLVPNRADAFWGIELDRMRGREGHVAYVTMRIRSVAEGRELLRMLFQGDPVQ
jgi:inner membrane protein